MSRFFIFLFFSLSLISGCAYRTIHVVNPDGSQTTTSETVYAPSPVYVDPYYSPRYYRGNDIRYRRDYKVCWYEHRREGYPPVLMCR